MDKNKIKAELYKAIDSIDEDQVLQVVYDSVVAYTTLQSPEITNELSEEQKKRLEESLQQSKNGEGISHDQMKLQIKEWSMK